MRLHDVYPLGFGILLFELGELEGENEGLGKEVEVGESILDLHLGDILVHQVLSGDLEGVREVVHLLVRIELGVDL